MASFLITGGAGFIGSHLADGLVARGDQVRILDDFSTGKDENVAHLAGKIEVVKGTVTDSRVVDDAVAGCEHVLHMGALPSVQRSVDAPAISHAACATGTIHVLDAARRLGVKRVIYAASSSAYGDIEGAVRSEAEPVSPMSPYAAAKLAGEHYCRCFTTTYGLETVRLRFFNIFGPRQDAKSPYSGVIALFIAAMTSRKQPTVYGDGLQSRDFTYVENVVQAVLQAVSAPAAAVGNVYNIGFGASTSVLDLVNHLNDILGTKNEPIFGPSRAGDVRHSQADISRARQDLGYDPKISFADGLRSTLEWYRSTAGK